MLFSGVEFVKQELLESGIVQQRSGTQFSAGAFAPGTCSAIVVYSVFPEYSAGHYLERKVVLAVFGAFPVAFQACT
ncbi:hypothetical protein J3A64_004825 [Pseudarthrobacter sp. PvP004]|nr:hypothetical protein [Pseudarthrobacter sp. PvP004]